MPKKQPGRFPKTQHSKIYDQGQKTENPFVTLDSPDDRITRQNGDGTTLVKKDNPDDMDQDI